MMNEKTILMLGALFYALSSPMMYEQVDKMVPVMDSNGPTPLGVLFHSIVFCIVLVLLRKNKLV